MGLDEVELAYKCGLDGSEWTARLGPVGPRLGFVSFRRAGEKVEPPPVNKAADLKRRLDELMSGKAALLPPRSADVVTGKRSAKLTEDQVTDYGFKCPSCGNTQTLLCPVCFKYSCRGAPLDAGGRIQCQWCGTTLVSGSAPAAGSNTPKRPPLEIEGTSERTEIRYRELPPGAK